MADEDRRVELLQTIPGIGKFFAALIANEVDDISRFATEKKFLDIIPNVDYGYYRVELKPGVYLLDINRIGIDHSGDIPKKIIVEPGQTVKVNIDIDTGIR
jgi:hypothetical protein